MCAWSGRWRSPGLSRRDGTLKVLARLGEPIPGQQVASGGDPLFGVHVVPLDGAQQRGRDNYDLVIQNNGVVQDEARAG